MISKSLKIMQLLTMHLLKISYSKKTTKCWFSFSTKKSNPNQQESNSQQNPQQQQSRQRNQSKINQQSNTIQQNDKQQKLRILQKRVNAIKQTKEQQQLQRIKKKIQLTEGKFNPLTHYFWLYRKQLFILLLIMTIAQSVRQFIIFSGVYEDPLTKKKKWMIINLKQEQKLSNFILSVFKKEKQFISIINRNIINSSSSLNKRLLQSSQRLNLKLNQMIAKYLNLKGQAKSFKIHIVDQSDCIITILPGNNIIVSNKMLICSQISQQHLQNVAFLLYLLFLRRYHIKELGIKEKSCFIQSEQTPKNIKLVKIYTRNYSNKQILQTLQLFRNKQLIKNDQQKNNTGNNASTNTNAIAEPQTIEKALLNSLQILTKISKKDQVNNSLYHRLNLSTLFDQLQKTTTKIN